MRNSSENIAEIALVELYFAYAELSAGDPASASVARALKHIKQAIKNLESITRAEKSRPREAGQNCLNLSTQRGRFA